MREHPAMAPAFNKGSDARLRGEPRTANPYVPDEEPISHFWWDDGWKDVEKNWGTGARTWTALPLPPVPVRA